MTVVCRMSTSRESQEVQATGSGATLATRLQRVKAPLLDTLTWLGQTEGTEGRGFFATHPATIDRIEALRTIR